MSTRTYSFIGGDTGVWRVVNTEVVVGQALPAAKRLAIVAGSEIPSEPRAAWVLRGITSNERYVDREERRQIVADVLDLGRPDRPRRPDRRLQRLLAGRAVRALLDPTRRSGVQVPRSAERQSICMASQKECEHNRSVMQDWQEPTLCVESRNPDEW